MKAILLFVTDLSQQTLVQVSAFVIKLFIVIHELSVPKSIVSIINPRLSLPVLIPFLTFLLQLFFAVLQLFLMLIVLARKYSFLSYPISTILYFASLASNLVIPILFSLPPYYFGTADLFSHQKCEQLSDLFVVTPPILDNQ